METRWVPDLVNEYTHAWVPMTGCVRPFLLLSRIDKWMMEMSEREDYREELAKNEEWQEVK